MKTSEKQLLDRYIEGTLSATEAEYVEELIRKGAPYSTYIEERRAEEKSHPEATEPVEEEKPRKRKIILSKAGIRFMIIGWVLLLIAMIFVLSDLWHKLSEVDIDKAKEKQQEIDSLQRSEDP